MTETLSARLRKCAEIAGSGDNLARITAIPRRTLEYYLTGDREPKVARCVEIAKAVGVDIGWLASGEGAMLAGQGAAPPATEVPGMEDYAFVPLYDAQCSAGPGAWNENCRVLTHICFTRYSLRKQGLTPEHLSAVRNDGDSMYPDISNGDTVLIDHTRTTIEGEGIYIIRLEDHLYAKRLQRNFDGVSVISTNKEYREVVVPRDRLHELEIIGRAVWAARWL